MVDTFSAPTIDLLLQSFQTDQRDDVVGPFKIGGKVASIMAPLVINTNNMCGKL